MADPGLFIGIWVNRSMKRTILVCGEGCTSCVEGMRLLHVYWRLTNLGFHVVIILTHKCSHRLDFIVTKNKIK